MIERSLSETITLYLKMAKVAHSDAVKAGSATDEDWPEWYGSYIAKRLGGYCAGLQSSVSPFRTVKGKWDESSIPHLPMKEINQELDAKRELTNVEARKAAAMAKFLASVGNCHDNGTCDLDYVAEDEKPDVGPYDADVSLLGRIKHRLHIGE